MARVRATAACPCGGATYAACCGRYIEGEAIPGSAEQLMRSRYSAYAMGSTAWLLATWHRTTRPTRLDLEPRTKWIGLQVLRHAPDSENADRAVVEFVARCRIDGRAHRMHETSRFLREGGRWYYLGEAEPGPAASAPPAR